MLPPCTTDNPPPVILAYSDTYGKSRQEGRLTGFPFVGKKGYSASLRSISFIPWRSRLSLRAETISPTLLLAMWMEAWVPGVIDIWMVYDKWMISDVWCEASAAYSLYVGCALIWTSNGRVRLTRFDAVGIDEE